MSKNDISNIDFHIILIINPINLPSPALNLFLRAGTHAGEELIVRFAGESEAKDTSTENGIRKVNLGIICHLLDLVLH